MGNGQKLVQEVERVNRAVGRRSIYVVADVAVGEVLGPENIRIIRPGAGIHPRYWNEVQGRRACRPLRKGEPLSIGDFA